METTNDSVQEIKGFEDNGKIRIYDIPDDIIMEIGTAAIDKKLNTERNPADKPFPFVKAAEGYYNPAKITPFIDLFKKDMEEIKISINSYGVILIEGKLQGGMIVRMVCAPISHDESDRW